MIIHQRHHLFFILLVMTMTSCTTVRLAIYDYQKKHASTYDTDSAPVVAASTVSKEKTAKLALTEKASKYIGSKYCYGSCEASKGFDCSGLVYHVAKSQEIILPRSSSTMASSGPRIPWKKAEPGDLVFFGDNNRIHHVGIVEKNKGNEFWIIHSSSSSGVVREDILVSDYWKSRVLFAIDIIASKNIKT